MDFISFLNAFSANPQFLVSYSVICFRADHYSALFFSYLLAYAKRKQLNKITFDLDQISLKEAQLSLDMLFLGQKLLYWLKDITVLEAAAKNSWFSYLNNYRGPHTISVFTGTESVLVPSSDLLIIEIPNFITESLYQEIFALFYADYAQEKLFVRKLFAHQERLGLDAAFLLMHYQSCLGRKSEQFFEQWLSKLVAADKSFFILSQYLFAQQPREFFKYWLAYRLDYPTEFWIAFWSEQLWQATIFVYKAKTEGISEAKKATSRLPFSFVNKDWRNYTHTFLAQSHAFLYTLDHDLKNGINNYGLELWYNKFFVKKFDT